MLWMSNASAVVAALCVSFCLSGTDAFVPSSQMTLSSIPHSRSVEFAEADGSTIYPIISRKRPILYAKGDDLHSENSFQINPLYGTLWIVFLGYVIFLSPGELLDATDTTIIVSFINDPSNTGGTINPLFFVVFNALGIMPIVMAQLLLPQGNQRGVSAAPFIVGSFGAGFGALGLYLALRKAPVTTKTRSDASWITSNVLESKLFNWIVVALCGSVLFSSGILTSGGDSLSAIFESFRQMASGSKLVAVSSVDLFILTVAAATLIPRDYRLRTGIGNEEAGGDSNNMVVAAAAASTILFPVVGAALYCALRPQLPEE